MTFEVGKAKTKLLSKTIMSALLPTFLLVALLAGCQADDEPATLRMAVLPILDALPMYVAEEQGYFAEQNLEVEFIPVQSAADRDQLIQAGQADGMINELLSTMFYNSDQPEVVTVRYARAASPEYPHFYILASGQSGIETADGLIGQSLGISEGTIIEYTSDRLLAAEGINPSDVEYVAVPRIPERLALLNSGELAAANMPDPLASLAIQNGAVIVVDDSSFPEFGFSTITFRKDILDENADAIRRFLIAIEKAVEDINTGKEQFNELLVDRQLVPEPILGQYAVPDFPRASVPTMSQWNDVLQWALSKEYIEASLDYNDSVDDSFLPR